MSKVSITVAGSKGKWASPYSLHGDVLVKNVQEKHIFKARWAIGVDESIWEKYKNKIRVVKFEFPDGSVREIRTDDFERKSFLHGDGITFAKTRFIGINELQLVREAPPHPRQLALSLGVGA